MTRYEYRGGNTYKTQAEDWTDREWLLPLVSALAGVVVGFLIGVSI